MALIKYSLGQLIERNKETNVDLVYGLNNVRGVLNTKSISNTKADVSGRDLSKFLVVKPGGFVFNHRVHDKLGLGYNTTNETYIFTNDYVAFYLKPEIIGKVLLPDYLYMWYLREEFDRYMLYKTYGSATLFFNWDDMCELEIELPPVKIQEKYVNVYKAMLANQQMYESGLEDLKLVCDGYIEELRRNIPCEEIGMHLEIRNEENTDLKYKDCDVLGVSQEKKIIPTKANTKGNDISKFTVIHPNDFVYNPRNGIAVGLNKKDAIISWNNTAFFIKDNLLIPEYLMIWLSRKEWDRKVKIDSWGSSTEVYSFDALGATKIPIPKIEIQQAISNIYKCYIERKQISERLKNYIKEICPILIKGSIEEAKKET